MVVHPDGSTGRCFWDRHRRARATASCPTHRCHPGPCRPGGRAAYPRLWTPVIILAGGSLIIALLNRAGQTNVSAALYVVLIDGSIAGFLVLKPMLNAGNLSDFDLFILAVLVGSMILPRVLIPVTGIVQIMLIVSIFALRPHDASLTQLIQSEGGHSYSALAGLLVLQAVGTGIAWLHAWSVERALLRASQAEELAEARAALSRQARLIAEHPPRRRDCADSGNPPADRGGEHDCAGTDARGP